MTQTPFDRGALEAYLRRRGILPVSCSIECIVKFSHGQSTYWTLCGRRVLARHDSLALSLTLCAVVRSFAR